MKNWGRVTEADAMREQMLRRSKEYQEISRWLTQRGARIDLAVEQWKSRRAADVLREWSFGLEHEVKKMKTPRPQVIGDGKRPT